MIIGKGLNLVKKYFALLAMKQNILGNLELSTGLFEAFKSFGQRSQELLTTSKLTGKSFFSSK